jgi:uncharacterized membrane protein YeaQ/YmgE (transglycosylase-associated protein family)
MLNLIAWAILGLLAGAIAKAIYPGVQGGGILATMILGIVGSLLGGVLFNLITTGTLALSAAAPFNIGGVIVAVLGAIVAIFLWGLFTNRTA